MKRLARAGIAGMALCSLALPPVGGAQVTPEGYERVTRADLERAMATEAAKGYDLTASTNAGRLWAFTLFQLAEQAQARGPQGSPLFIHEADYYHAFLSVTGLDEAGAPEFIRMSHQYGQHTAIEYRMDRVVDASQTSTPPRVALAVRTWWPESEKLGDSYAYQDTLSDPTLLVVNEQEVTYKLLDFGDQFVYDEMEGIRGRPTSGVLGLLFDLLGTGKIVWSRMAISDDGWQVVRAKAKKLVSKTATATVRPDGTGGEVPEDREDLVRIADRLERDLDVAYLEWPL
jgi:hypothetical protein